eukprot:gene942-1059_t
MILANRSDEHSNSFYTERDGVVERVLKYHGTMQSEQFLHREYISSGLEDTRGIAERSGLISIGDYLLRVCYGDIEIDMSFLGLEQKIEVIQNLELRNKSGCELLFMYGDCMTDDEAQRDRERFKGDRPIGGSSESEDIGLELGLGLGLDMGELLDRGVRSGTRKESSRDRSHQFGDRAKERSSPKGITQDDESLSMNSMIQLGLDSIDSATRVWLDLAPFPLFSSDDATGHVPQDLSHVIERDLKRSHLYPSLCPTMTLQERSEATVARQLPSLAEDARALIQERRKAFWTIELEDRLCRRMQKVVDDSSHRRCSPDDHSPDDNGRSLSFWSKLEGIHVGSAAVESIRSILIRDYAPLRMRSVGSGVFGSDVSDLEAETETLGSTHSAWYDTGPEDDPGRSPRSMFDNGFGGEGGARAVEWVGGLEKDRGEFSRTLVEDLEEELSTLTLLLKVSAVHRDDSNMTPTHALIRRAPFRHPGLPQPLLSTMSFHGGGSTDTSALIRSPVPEREVYTERLQKALLCPQLSLLTDDRVVPLLSAWVALLPTPVGGSVRRTSYPPESSPPSSSTIKTVSRSRSSSLKSEQQRDRSPEGVATRQLATLFLALQSAGPWLLDLRALSRSTVSGGYSFSWMSSGFGVSVSGLKLAFSYFPLQHTVCFAMDSLWSEAELCKRAKLYARKVDLDVVLEISNLRQSCQGVLTALRIVLSNDIAQLELSRVKEYLNTFRDNVRCKEAWTEDSSEIDVEVENWLTTMMREINGYEDVVPERLSIWLLALPLAFQTDGR